MVETAGTGPARQRACEPVQPAPSRALGRRRIAQAGDAVACGSRSSVLWSTGRATEGRRRPPEHHRAGRPARRWRDAAGRRSITVLVERTALGPLQGDDACAALVGRLSCRLVARLRWLLRQQGKGRALARGSSWRLCRLKCGAGPTRLPAPCDGCTAAGIATTRPARPAHAPRRARAAGCRNAAARFAVRGRAEGPESRRNPKESDMAGGEGTPGRR
jgi:hypothetical protein